MLEALLSIVILGAIIGLIAYLVTLLPIDGRIKQAITAVIIFVFIIYLILILVGGAPPFRFHFIHD